MEAFHAEVGANGLALDVAIEERETLQMHGVKTVTVVSNNPAVIRWVAHLELGPWQ
jgi:hypothetical protein